MLLKSKGKTVNTYLKLINSIIKPIIIMLYACECWGNSLKKGLFNDEIEKLHLSICNQVLGVKRTTNSMKVMAALEKYLLKLIQKQPYLSFKYLSRI